MSPRLFAFAAFVLVAPVRAGAVSGSSDASVSVGTNVDFSFPLFAIKGDNLHLNFQVYDDFGSPAFTPALTLKLEGPAVFTGTSWGLSGTAVTLTTGPTDVNGTASAEIRFNDVGTVTLCATVSNNVPNCRSLQVVSKSLSGGVQPTPAQDAAPVGTSVALVYQVVDGNDDPQAVSVSFTAHSDRSDCAVKVDQNPTNANGTSTGSVICSGSGQVTVCAAPDLAPSNLRCAGVQFIASTTAAPTLVMALTASRQVGGVAPGSRVDVDLQLNNVPLNSRSVVALSTSKLTVTELCWQRLLQYPLSDCEPERVLTTQNGAYPLPSTAAGLVRLKLTAYADGQAGDTALAQATLRSGDQSGPQDKVEVSLVPLPVHLGCSSAGGPVGSPSLLALLGVLATRLRSRPRRRP